MCIRDSDLGEQLRECLLSFESQWEAKELEIEADIEEDVTVEADGQLLSLVWNNLLSNAIKFTDDGGKISVSLKISGPMAIVKVADTGLSLIHIFLGKGVFLKKENIFLSSEDSQGKPCLCRLPGLRSAAEIF